MVEFCNNLSFAEEKQKIQKQIATYQASYDSAAWWN